MTREYRIDEASATHVGEVRADNEDSHAAIPDSRVWLVADGMGGHVNGKFASEAIVSAAMEANYPEPLEEACDVLAAAIHAANARIFAQSVEVGAQMGSTFVALVLRADEFAVLWSGDSRAYVFRDDQLIQLTTDHTQVQAMLDHGLLTPEEALTHPMRHVLARAVGVEDVLQIDAVRDFAEPRDLFMLCSDGLYGQVTNEEIADALREDGVGACDRLIARCLETGAPDNITITLVEVQESTLLVQSGEG